MLTYPHFIMDLGQELNKLVNGLKKICSLDIYLEGMKVLNRQDEAVCSFSRKIKVKVDQTIYWYSVQVPIKV